MSAQQNLGGYKRVSATGNISPRGVGVIGFLVSTTTAGTIQFYDDSATGTTTPITGVITPAAGSFTPMNLATTNGLHAVIGGTLDVTIVYA